MSQVIPETGGQSLAILPEPWQQEVEALLSPAEQILAGFELDLNSDLRFGTGMVVLTNQRIVSIENADLQDSIAPGTQSWKLANALEVSTSIYGGLGQLVLSIGGVRQATWHFTTARESLAQHFASVVVSAIHTRSSQRADGSVTKVTRCVSCGATLTAQQPVCFSCAPSAAPSPSNSLLRLVPFAKRRWRTITLGLALTVAATAVGLVPPYLSMPLLDRVLIPRQNGVPIDPQLVMTYFAGLIAAALLAWLLGWAKTYTLALASEQVSADLRNHSFSHLQRLSLEFFGGRRTGDLISRISTDTERICYFLSLHLVDFTSDLLMFVLTSCVLIAIDPVLAAATLIPFPFIALLVQRIRSRLGHGFSRAGNAWGDMVSVLTDAIPGIRVVKAFAQEQREVERFAASNQRVLDANVRVNRLWAFFGPTVTLLTELGVLVIWGFGVWRVSSGSITVGVLTAFLAYISRFYVRLDSMSRMLANTQRAASATYRIFEILDRIPTVAQPVRPIEPGRLAGNLSIRNVSFKYGSREVLQDIDLEIRPGELIGLVGPSGSGKSTLVNLVCRFYDATQGTIMADGNDIRSFPVEAYRRNIGIVLQEPFLFFGTIAENIAYGRPDASRDEIVQAARGCPRAPIHHSIA